MALRDRVQLLPPVHNRYGILWSNKALTTHDFETSFCLTGKPTTKTGANDRRDGVLAFWISPENFTASFSEQNIVAASKDWDVGLKQAGLSFIANKPKFTGLAVIFLGSLPGGPEPKQAIAAVWNDGSKTIDLNTVADQANTHKLHDWLQSPTMVKVHVTKDGEIVGSVMTLDISRHFAGTIWGWSTDGVSVAVNLQFDVDFTLRSATPDAKESMAALGNWSAEPGSRVRISFGVQSYTLRLEGAHMAVMEEEEPWMTGGPPVLYYGGQIDKAKPQDGWTEVFRLPSGTFPATAKESFVGFSGWSGSQNGFEADLNWLETTNYDRESFGEEDLDALGDSSGQWLQVIEQERQMIDQAGQGEAIDRLKSLLANFTAQYNDMGERLREKLVGMETRMEVLGADISTYHGMAQAWKKEALAFDPATVRDHIVGIRSAIATSNQVHDTKLGAVHEAARTLKARKEQDSRAGAGGKAKVQSVAQQAASVEEMAARGSMQTNGLLAVIVIAFACLGLLFLNRMRYYEKKHYI
mmetsp:Transcript_88300/g.250253  ORF Transcript_88300/g.250253 Transcript_88300/m.250253 type:complete len:526 (+) Transcript_88300:1-1578(+)